MESEWNSTPTSKILAQLKDETAEYLAVQRKSLLVALSGPTAGTQYLLENETTIGSDLSATICLPDTDLAGCHARLRRAEDGSFVLEDAEGESRTLRSGNRVTATRLKPGDQLQLGETISFVFALSPPFSDDPQEEKGLALPSQAARDLAHDFNNLMAAILADTESLRRRLEDAVQDPLEALDRLRNVETAARRATLLTEQLLGLADRRQAEHRPVVVGRLIDAVVRAARPILGPSVTTEVEVSPDLMVSGDEAQLRMALANLCGSARSAMPRGGTLTIRAMARALGAEEALKLSFRPGPYVLLTVQNTGQGMDAATREHAFEPTPAPGGEGGLGLVSVRNVVESHAGHVEVDSEPDAGTTFRVYLPSADALSREPTEKTLLPRAQPISHTILLVEDVELQRSAATRLLEGLGHRVIGARDGKEAIRLFMAHRQEISVVLLDLLLPNLSGRDTLRWLKKIDAQIKVILTSGYVGQSRAGEILAEGAVAFLPKPYDRDALEQAILQAMGDEAPSAHCP